MDVFEVSTSSSSQFTDSTSLQVDSSWSVSESHGDEDFYACHDSHTYCDPWWVSDKSFHKKFVLVMRFIICVVGVAGNVIILRTFLKIGLKDSVTLVLFNLAVADLNFLTTSLVICVCHICEDVPDSVFSSYKLHPFAIENFCSNYIHPIFASATIYCTTLVALQRCLCVMKPLHFNGIFTRKLTFIILAVIWCISLSKEWVGLQWNKITSRVRPSTNGTWLTLYFVSMSKWNAYVGYDQIVVGVVNGLCQATMVLSIFLMIRDLNRSVRFRKSASNKQQGQKYNVNDVDESKAAEKTNPSKSDNVGSKERRITIQVSLVAGVFILTNFHRLFFEIAIQFQGVRSFIWANWGFYERYMDVRRILLMFNSSVNVFIYLIFNTKFRQASFNK